METWLGIVIGLTSVAIAGNAVLLVLIYRHTARLSPAFSEMLAGYRRQLILALEFARPAKDWLGTLEAFSRQVLAASAETKRTVLESGRTLEAAQPRYEDQVAEITARLDRWASDLLTNAERLQSAVTERALKAGAIASGVLLALEFLTPRARREYS